MVVPTLNAEEYQLNDTGVKLNGASAVPFVDIERVDGLDSAPIDPMISGRDNNDGSWVDAFYERERTVVLEGTVYASVTTLETYLDSLKANWAPSKTDVPLYIGTDAGTRAVWGKPLGLRYSKEQQRRTGKVSVQFMMTAGDPTVYSPTPVSQAIVGTITMSGNRKTAPTFTLTGGTTITLGGKTMTYTGSSAGVVIDVLNRTVTLSGSSVRANLSFSAGATWEDFYLSPGANVISGSATGTVAAKSAWR